MNQTQNPKVVPAALDGIPREVATSMLVARKAKLTARMRKNCQAARCKVYPSVAPIINIVDSEKGKGQGYAMDARIAPEIKLARRATGLKWEQLHSHLKRMVKRRTQVQKAYLKLMASPASESQKDSMGRLLTREAGKLELAQDVLSGEIQRREKLTRLERI